MNSTILQQIQDKLLQGVNPKTRTEIENGYSPRRLSSDAIVTRSAPSPTGFVHIGTVYMCLLNQYLARQSGGVYMLRVEDTDKKREIKDGVSQIVNTLQAFDLVPDEGVRADSTSYGDYGPYLQSERKELYLAFALELLHAGRAYPCFATKEQLEDNVHRQQAAKVRPGYYGQWAIWRDASDEQITKELELGTPFVLRFRSQGSHDKRVVFDDVLKGHLELPENDLDVPLIKADGTQLPTYHLAHVVDDYLMQTNLILRGDEWLPSTPLHMELCDALNITRFRYAHFAPISIIDKNGGGKRKLSKRKDPEADVTYWLSAGYPLEGVKAYLLGLANSNFEDWYRENHDHPLTDFVLTLDKLAASRAPLLDHAKLDDYCKDVIASLPLDKFTTELVQSQTNEDFVSALKSDSLYTQAVLGIERTGEKPRKDMAKWSDAYEQYAYFFDNLYAADFSQRVKQLLSGFSDETIQHACEAFLLHYQQNDEQHVWFEKLKQAAESVGFSTDNKVFKTNPDKFMGNTADFAKILRVKLTGKDRTPDLYTIMQVMGRERVINRLKV